MFAITRYCLLSYRISLSFTIFGVFFSEGFGESSQSTYHSGPDTAGGPTSAGSKSLVTASTRYSGLASLFRDHPPIAWYPAIANASITGKPHYIGTDGPSETEQQAKTYIPYW